MTQKMIPVGANARQGRERQVIVNRGIVKDSWGRTIYGQFCGLFRFHEGEWHPTIRYKGVQYVVC